jgi:hypothetical protein
MKITPVKEIERIVGGLEARLLKLQKIRTSVCRTGPDPDWEHFEEGLWYLRESIDNLKRGLEKYSERG